MRIFLMAAFIVSISFNGLCAQDKTSQLGIGVYDLIFKGTNFPNVKCESYSVTSSLMTTSPPWK